MVTVSFYFQTSGHIGSEDKVQTMLFIELYDYGDLENWVKVTKI